MKRDVTQTGLRTRKGMLNDAVSFMKRYISNNYQDYQYQNGINFLLGNKLSFDSFFLPTSDKEEDKLKRKSAKKRRGKDENSLSSSIQETLLFGVTAVMVYCVLL
jgi:hypothetical protein